MSGSDLMNKQAEARSPFIDHQHPYYLLDYLIPRPADKELHSTQLKYYEAASAGFDEFNEQQSVLGFLGTINNFLVSELKDETPLKHLISIAAGTGARERLVRKLSGREFDITVCDLSPSMCQHAESSGLKSICGAWEEINYEPDLLFDACLFIFSFECIVNRSRRIEALRKINRIVRMQAPLFLDICNVHDRNGLGPEVERRFYLLDLKRYGYELGDLYYRRDDIANSICFCHYSSKQEMTELLTETGFEIESLLFLDESGNILQDSQDGTMLFKAVKVRALG